MKTIVISILAILLAYLAISYSNEDTINKINGVCLVAPRFKIESHFFKPVKETQANWVAVIPFGFTRSGQSQVYFDHPRQWLGERVEGTIQQIIEAKKNGFKVMLKPHLWVQGEGWPGDFELHGEDNWNKWEEQYSQYVLTYAALADSLDVEMFCIGTELRRVVTLRPQYWEELVPRVRGNFSGQITYASNWDNYSNVTFWDKLDFIGIDAYFPVSSKEDASVTDLIEGWAGTFSELEEFSDDHGKRIIFTEFGYQSVTGTAGNHWELEDNQINMNAQSNAYEALFKVFWGEHWFAGGFFWKWHFKNDRGGLEDPNFTPQGKPALSVIKHWYSTHR